MLIVSHMPDDNVFLHTYITKTMPREKYTTNSLWPSAARRYSVNNDSVTKIALVIFFARTQTQLPECAAALETRAGPASRSSFSAPIIVHVPSST